MSLVELVARFEAGHGHDIAGGYDGIVPEHYRFGDPGDYFLGRARRQTPRRGAVWLLGCECGEVGCWPLEAAVEVTEESVVWSGFRQPFRPERDYGAFGPFRFDREQYERAVDRVRAEFPER